MADVAAHRIPELDVDELVEDKVLGLQAQANLAVLNGPGVLDGGLGGCCEDFALAFAFSLECGRVVHLFEDARHGEDKRGLKALEVLEQVLDVGGVANLGSARHRQHRNVPGKNVGQGQEHDCLRTWHHHRFAQHGQRIFAQFHKVVVHEHAALGAACGARGVNDGCHVVQAVCRAGSLQDVVGDIATRFAQGIQAVAFELPDMRDRGEALVVGGLADDVFVGAGFSENGYGLGVAQIPSHLRR